MPKKHTDDELARMSMGELSKLRSEKGADQDRLAPYEHRAFMRDEVGDNPGRALVFGIAIPAYTAVKMLNKISKYSPLLAVTLAATDMDKSRSSASMEEITQGFKGINEGLEMNRHKRRNQRGGAAANALHGNNKPESGT